MTNLSFAAIGFCCVGITDRAREVGMFGYLIFLVGAAFSHISQYLFDQNENAANIGKIVLVDIGVLLVAQVLLWSQRRLGEDLPARN